MSIEMDSPMTALSQGMMLNLVLQSRQQATRYSALLLLLPFLGLHGPLRSTALENRWRLPAMPWPLLRWFGWAGGVIGQPESVSSQQLAVSDGRNVREQSAVSRQPSAVSGEWSVVNDQRAFITHHPASSAITPGERLPLLALLSPLLFMTKPFGEGGQRSKSNLVSSPAQPTQAGEPGQMRGRTAVPNQQPTLAEQSEPFVWPQFMKEGKQVSPTGLLAREQAVAQPGPISATQMGDELPDRRPLPALPHLPIGQPARSTANLPAEQQLPNLNPALMGILGIAVGSEREMNQTVVTRERPLPLSSVHEPIFRQGTIPAVSRPGAAQGSPNGRKPERFASSSIQGLTIITSHLERWLKREVTAEVKRQHENETRLSNQRNEPSLTAVPPPISDDMVRQMMNRMRDLAQEEQFRMGRIR